MSSAAHWMAAQKNAGIEIRSSAQALHARWSKIGLHALRPPNETCQAVPVGMMYLGRYSPAPYTGRFAIVAAIVLGRTAAAQTIRWRL